MARPLRIQRTGCWYHVTARGNERRAIFLDDRDRRHFLELLERMVGMFGLRLHAFVLMSNHYHLLIEPGQANLSRAVQWLNTSYSVWFNHRHGRSGHLLQGRFKSIVVERESWGLELSRYIHLNPVRLGRFGLGKGEVQKSRLVGVEKLDAEQVRQRIEQLRRYPWSSYRAYIGSAKVPPWLSTEAVLALGGKSAAGREEYRDYCEQAIREGAHPSPWEKVVGQAVLGTERFVTRLARALEQTETGARLRDWVTESRCSLLLPLRQSDTYCDRRGFSGSSHSRAIDDFHCWARPQWGHCDSAGNRTEAARAFRRERCKRSTAGSCWMGVKGA
jgi:REP element-mobilizing transposase RayT